MKRLSVLLLLAACSSATTPQGPAPEGQANNNDNNGGGADASTEASPSEPKGPPPARVPPAHGALFGAFVGVGTESEKDFAAQEELLGRKWVIDNRFYSWEDWINDRTRWDIAQKKIPLITWEPQHQKLDDILAGKHDEEIKTRARGARDLKVEMYMRWGHEMNGNWYPWSGAKNGGKDGPPKYIAAYRYVHDMFVKEGATNVIWVWNPLVTDVPNEPWNHWTNYYPGDEYVDWVGLDAYNWGSSSSCCVWTSFSDLITDLYKDYAGKKPLMIPETSSAEVGGSKAKWIADMHRDLKSKFTAIKALVWFDINKETDWRIASSPATLEAYKAMAHDPYFNP